MSLDKINDDLVEQLPPSAIKHFFEKLLKLESLMHTDTAKMIAKERQDFMMMYLKQFLRNGIITTRHWSCSMMMRCNGVLLWELVLMPCRYDSMICCWDVAMCIMPL